MKDTKEKNKIKGYEVKKDVVEKMKKLNIDGWKERHFKAKIEKFIEDYRLDKKYFFKNYDGDKPQLQINSKYSGLFYILARTYNVNPYLERKGYSLDRVDLKQLLMYYDEVIKSIDEELEEEERYNIVNSYQYITMIQERSYIKKLIEKLNELEIAMNKVTSKDRADFFRNMHGHIDAMICELYEYKLNREKQEEIERNIYINQIKQVKTAEKLYLNIDNPVIDKYDCIKLIVQDKLIKENEELDNISEFLIKRLKDEMSIYSFPDDLQTKDEKLRKEKLIYEEYKSIKEYQKKVFQMIGRATGKDENEIIEIMKKRKPNLIDDINKNIKRIENECEQIVTIEDEYREILKCIEEGSIYRGYTKYGDIRGLISDKSYYEGYLKFIEEIKQECKSINKESEVLKKSILKKNKAI